MQENLNNMRVSRYLWKYTHRKRVVWGRVWLEVQELIEAIRAWDEPNIKEEIGDVVLFFQIWLFWKFSLDLKVWRITHHSCRKFIARQAVWTEIYEAAGLNKNLSPSTANYKRLHKVVERLAMYGVDETGAIKAFERVVLPRLELHERKPYIYHLCSTTRNSN